MLQSALKNTVATQRDVGIMVFSPPSSRPSPPREGESFGIVRLFYAHPPIQPWMYPEARGAFHLLQGEKAGLRAGKSFPSNWLKFNGYSAI
jgi:hypothetical protein